MDEYERLFLKRSLWSSSPITNVSTGEKELFKVLKMINKFCFYFLFYRRDADRYLRMKLVLKKIYLVQSMSQQSQIVLSPSKIAIQKDQTVLSTRTIIRNLRVVKKFRR